MEELREKHLNKLQTIDNVQVRAYPLFQAIPYGIEYHMPILVQVLGGRLPENYKRCPINLCIVLDRSGSMGKTIESCKEAIYKIIDQMGNDDTINLVIYDNQIETVFTDKHKSDNEEIVGLVKNIKARSTTNLFGGIEQGIKILKNSESIGTKIMFLFSDGLANVGIKDGETIGIKTKELCGEDEIFVTTFGIGSDYDEKLMSSIAKSGSGYYYYISNNEIIPNLVKRGIDGLTKYWSKNTKLYVQGENGTLVTQMVGNTNLFSGKSLKIREFAFHQYLIYANSGSNANGHVNILLKYTDYNGENKQITTGSVWKVDKAILEFNEEENPNAKCYLTMLECSEMNQKLSIMINERKPEADILRIKESIIKKYESVIPCDEFFVIAPLLYKEMETLEEFKNNGVYSKNAVKMHDYNAAKACGFSNQVYAYAEEEEESDEDMGFGLFD